MKQKTKFQIQGKFAKRVPKSKKEEQEFGPGKKDIIICPKCNAYYFYKSWHHKLEDYRHLSDKKRVKFILCPACQMIRDGKYEGQIILKNVPEDKKEEILNLIKNIGKRAYNRDPMDRIIDIREIRGKLAKISNIEILTTENQLAVRIGKQLKRTFKGRLEIKYSHEESTTRVIWEQDENI